MSDMAGQRICQNAETLFVVITSQLDKSGFMNMLTFHPGLLIKTWIDGCFNCQINVEVLPKKYVYTCS